MTESDPKEKICPLCGGDNQCAMAAGKPPESCWCQEATFDKEALEAIPAESQGKHCLCPACGRLTEDSSLAR